MPILCSICVSPILAISELSNLSDSVGLFHADPDSLLQLCQKKADYILPVKANQEQTYEDTQLLFTPEMPPKTDVDSQVYQARTFETPHQETLAHTDTFSCVERAHRITENHSKN